MVRRDHWMRLKHRQIKNERERLLDEQGNTCALCGKPLSRDRAGLDHDHKTGIIRGTLHLGCNALLGKCENNAKRYGVNIFDFARGLSQYIEYHREDRTGLIHPTHRTPEEKKKRKKRNAYKKMSIRRKTGL